MKRPRRIEEELIEAKVLIFSGEHLRLKLNTYGSPRMIA